MSKLCLSLDVWTQVMAQLRQGIRLKKVDYSRTPAEYELTPYEVGWQRSCNVIIRLS